jgi:hypothetical protein
MILALNPMATLRRARPRRWLALTASSCLLALAGLALFDPRQAWTWLAALFFGFCAGVFLLLGLLFRGKRYRPGQSFRHLRASDGTIRQGHKAGWILGLVVILGYAVYGLLTRSVLNLLDGLVTGIGMILAAYWAMRAKRAHLDVDPDAAALSPGPEVPTLAYANFEGPAEPRKGRAALLVGADSLTLSECDGTAWASRKRLFSDLRELGLAPDPDHSLQIYFRFAQGDDFTIRMDPTEVGTADPLTFCRSFLERLDRSLAQRSSPAARPRNR